jgi:hypothetical protein
MWQYANELILYFPDTSGQVVRWRGPCLPQAGSPLLGALHVIWPSALLGFVVISTSCVIRLRVIMDFGVIGCVARWLALRALVGPSALLNGYLWLLVVYYWAWRYYLC